MMEARRGSLPMLKRLEVFMEEMDCSRIRELKPIEGNFK